MRRDLSSIFEERFPARSLNYMMTLGFFNSLCVYGEYAPSQAAAPVSSPPDTDGHVAEVAFEFPHS